MLPINVPDISEHDIFNAVKVLRSGWLLQGKQVEALEKAVAKYVGVQYAVAVSSGTAALHLSLLAHGIGKGDEVIVPAYTFVATANAVSLTGAKPVFVDIDIDTLCIDPKLIKGSITDKTRSIMPVHAFGLCADMESILDIAKSHRLHVIEDAACAIGSEIKGKKAGSFGDIGCFSFHGRKIITSGEGGMITTNDLFVRNNLRRLRSHGIENGWCGMPGFNYRMTDIQAALLIGQLDRLDQTIEKRTKMAQEYMKSIDGIFQKTPTGYKHNYNTFHVMFRENERECLYANGIESTHGANCIPDEPYYRKPGTVFPNARKARKQGALLPIYNETKTTIKCLNDLH
jgi:perosamine synthetase